MSRQGLIVDGNTIALGREIGRGGEGKVFAISNQPDLAVKLYSKPDKEREQKIEAMVAAGLHQKSSLIAFPVSVVRDRNGGFAGFSMRLVKGHEPLHELYAPGARKATFPEADYRFLIHAARNISIAVSQVHDTGCVIGDINHSGILISNKAIAALIDADSFQFGTRFKCRVGVPEYTPPELQGRSLRGVYRTPVHDAFGLAVVIFQMLFMGRHPYVGRFASGDISIQEAISSGRFVYARKLPAGVKPPPASAGLYDFPSDLGSMFEAAFDSDHARRPTAKMWVDALEALEHALSRCRENDLHYFPSAAGSCLWCKLERASGAVLFEKPLPAGIIGRDPGADSFDLNATWRAIAAVKIPKATEVEPSISVSSPEPSDDIQQLLNERKGRVLTGLAMMVGAAVIAGVNFGLWFIYMPLGLWGYTRAYNHNSTFAPVQDRYRNAHEAYERAKSEWYRRIGLEELNSRRQELTDAKARYEGLADAKRSELSRLHSSRQQAQLRRHLERYRLRPGIVSGIGRGKVATLASYGIDTAADIDRGRIMSIQGFGQATTAALLGWKQSIVSRFQYNANMTPEDREDVRRTERKYDAEARKLRQTLSGGVSELRQTVAQMKQRANRSDPSVNKAAQDLEQAKVDLDASGAPVPTIRPTTRPPTTVQIASSGWPSQGKGSSRSGIPSCPRCGRGMIRRLARRGRNRGNYFWGCSRYPSCRGTRSI